MEEHDFSGYVTKNDLRCADGRTIKQGSFTHQDGEIVPLVWKHGHDSPKNVLGHVLLEDREDGVYGYIKCNDTADGVHSKAMVKHGDIRKLSIYANGLIEKAMDVIHGNIREVSLVMNGANPGAYIDSINLAHGDGIHPIDGEAIITTDIPIELFHADDGEDEEDAEDETIQDIMATLDEKQANAVALLLDQALGNADDEEESDEDVEHSDDDTDEDPNDEDSSITHSKDSAHMAHNVFETKKKNGAPTEGGTLTHDAMDGIFTAAKAIGSMKEAVEDYALKHGIEDIAVLFPDAQNVTQTPEFLKRRTEWVATVLDKTRHTPFARIRSQIADLTPEEARAKGYIKGNMKREEFFKVSKRTTTPQTIYKKQKLDRDDIVDITSFDVVAWMRAEMRLMLDEEVARAILVGDGRSIGDDDKVDEDHIRPIASDNELYQTTIYVKLDANTSADEIIDAVTLQRRHYRGSGSPTFFTSETYLAKMLLTKDTLGRRIYSGVADLAAALRVTEIIPVEVMEEHEDLVAIMVDLRDYSVGTNQGGKISLFDDFDIDYNQYKYLIETRLSGALVKPKAALVIRKAKDEAVLVSPVAPTLTGDKVTVPTVTGVIYKNKLTGALISSGTPVTLVNGDSITVIALPASENYYFATSEDDEWTFTYEG